MRTTLLVGQERKKKKEKKRGGGDQPPLDSLPGVSKRLPAVLENSGCMTSKSRSA
jgi:hypothetical protein